MSERAAALRLEGVSKRFVGVQALDDVDFELRRGEVHALLGENGAGKSTLVRIMTGADAPDAGRLLLHGEAVHPASPADAQRLGISAVYQEVNLLPNLSVAQNVFLGREPTRHGVILWRQLHAECRTLLERFGLHIDVTRVLSSYSIAVQQLVAIARGVHLSAGVLVLDEPTASLDAAEVSLLFEIVEEITSSGLAVVFVTHFLGQAYAISDRITVLRNGRRVGTWDAASLPRSELVGHMLGRELESVEHEPRQAAAPAGRAPAVEARELSAGNGLRSVSFSAGKAEALGVAGLLGSGRTELCETLFGLADSTGGTLEIFGRPQRFASPAAAVRAGLALCPEDRKSAGIVGSLSVRENIALALQARRGWWRRVPARERRQMAENAIRDFGIACPSAESPAEALSGGNQQKLLLARWLCNRPRILVLDEPTRGIDIGAHAEIIRLIRQLRDDGLTVIVASSEIEELIAFSDRVLVMRDLTAVTELAGSELDESAVVAALAQSA